MRTWFERLFKGSYVPHVIEPSAGLDRMALAVIAKAFEESEKVDEKGKKESSPSSASTRAWPPSKSASFRC